MQAIVLAAAGGPEFGPLCQGTSKGMLPFLGEPLLARVIRYLERQGASRVHVNLCEQPYQVESYFQKHPTQGPVSFHLEHAHGGTAASVKRLANNTKGTLVVMMGDLVTDVDLDEVFAFHKLRESLVTMVLAPGDRAARAGRVEIDELGRVRSFEEGSTDASRLVNTGIYLIEPEALVHVPAGVHCDFGRDLFPALVEKNLAVYGYQASGYWMDAGHPAGYACAVSDVLHGRVAHVEPRGNQISPGIWVEAGASVHPKAKLLAPAFVGRGARLDQEVKLGPVAAAEGPCHMARGAKLQSGFVFPDTYVGKATSWDSQILYPDGLIELAATPPRVLPAPAAEVLGTTYKAPLAERSHTYFDQAIAALGLFIISPLMLLITLAIKLDSPGPAMYTQLRVGQDRRPYRHGTPRGSIFEVYKFRTMHVDADAKVAELMAQNQYAGGAFFKMEKDPRITRLGHFLRKSSLDELPQLINVLLGEMRLVGNRPLPVYEADALVENWQRTRFRAPAGITGLWQISGRSDLSEKERLALDAYYTVNRTFRSDFAILVKTIPSLLLRRGAR